MLSKLITLFLSIKRLSVRVSAFLITVIINVIVVVIVNVNVIAIVIFCIIIDSNQNAAKVLHVNV